MKLDKQDPELLKELKVEITELNDFENCCLTVANVFFCLLLPIYLLSTIKIVNQRTVLVFSSFGKIIDVRDEPGCIFYPKVCCVNFHQISTAI